MTIPRQDSAGDINGSVNYAVTSTVMCGYPPEEISLQDSTVTVCVAAICDTSTVFGAADRMLTAGDVEFEPAQSKIWELTSSIAAMFAGDASLQSEIFQLIDRDVKARVEAEPKNWWTVRDVADLYSKYYAEIRVRRSEKMLLAPLGLDHKTFIERQREMSQSLVRQLATEMINFTMPEVGTIFTGIDSGGAHIYVAHGANVNCADNVGFAAIGIGRWHANSQFMFAQHNKSKPFPETLLLTYAAKKRAEVSPGVGEGTDMFTIGPALGSYMKIYPHVVGSLEKMYRANRTRERRASLRANKEVNEYVEGLIRAATPKEEQPAQAPGGDAPIDETKPREGAQNPPAEV